MTIQEFIQNEAKKNPTSSLILTDLINNLEICGYAHYHDMISGVLLGMALADYITTDVYEELNEDFEDNY